jgi:hypothetical protein
MIMGRFGQIRPTLAHDHETPPARAGERHAAFIPAFLTALGIGHSFLKFVTPLTYPSSEAGLAIGIWYAIGIVVLVYLYARHRERLAEMRKVFDEEALPAAEPVTQ